MQPTLGPFELGERIGEGGMGHVYRAVHHSTGVDAAIKVIGDAGSDDKTRRFHREVRAHAGLVHPGVVYLFDSGIVDHSTAAQSNLVADSPYVAMEFADRGTVDDLAPIDDWATVHNILIQTLDALAFAHARGVIHRDLKPENLLCFDDHRRLRIKLADFGIAHALDDIHRHGDETLQSTTGTPYYMPPEQVRGKWRSYGPWTDLYALGCVAYELICGRPPFVAETTIAIAMEHCTGDRPALSPCFDIPEQAENWIHRAMAIDPDRRFRRAADAADALPSTQTTTVSTDDSAGGDGQSISLAETLPLTTLSTPTSKAKTLAVSEVNDDSHSTPSPPETKAQAPELPVPESWRRTRAASQPTRLVGTGTGLFGLRPTPFVDRNEQRDRIWKTLQQAVEDDLFRLVVVSGQAGTGKSRLVRWLAERAHELGIATVLRAVHTPGGSSSMEGLPGLIRRTFHAWRMSCGEFYEHLQQHLPALDNENARMRRNDARALTEIVHPTDDPGDADGPRFQFESQRQKWKLMGRLLERFSRRRTSILWLDDLQWGSEVRDLVEYLMEPRTEQPPALILATLRSDVVAANPKLADQVDNITADDRSQHLQLSRLAPKDHRVFIDRMLPLKERLSDWIAARTEGNPLFAHHLLGDLIKADSLELGDAGFDLRDGESLSLPDDIHQLWVTRIDRLVAGLGNDHKQNGVEAIELAAALGREIDDTEWRAVCAEAGIAPPQQLVDKLIESGLAEDTQEGWAFTHELLVDSLGRHARDAQRWQTHHHHCAAMLERRHPDHPLHIARRRAEHWIEAGELDRALAPLLDESTRLKQLGAHKSRQRVLNRRTQLIDEIGLDSEARARLENELEVTNHRYKSGQFQGLIGPLKDVLQRCLDADQLDLASRAHQGLAVCARHSEDADAIEHLQHAIDLARRCDDDILLGKALISMGWQKYRIADYDNALDHGRAAANIFASRDHPYFHMHTQLLCATIQIAYSNFNVAQSILEPLVERAARWGLGPVEMEAANALGDLARFRGDPDEARRMGRRALDVVQQLDGDIKYVAALVNLAQIELLDERFDIARQYLAEADNFSNQTGFHQYPLLHHYIELGLAAGQQRWERFDRLLDEEIDYSSRSRDFAWLLELTADFANSHGRDRRARRLLKLSRQQWSDMDCRRAVERIDDKLRHQSD